MKKSFQIMCGALEGVSKGEQELHDSFKCMYVVKPYSDSDLSVVCIHMHSYNPYAFICIRHTLYTPICLHTFDLRLRTPAPHTKMSISNTRFLRQCKNQRITNSHTHIIAIGTELFLGIHPHIPNRPNIGTQTTKNRYGFNSNS